MSSYSDKFKRSLEQIETLVRIPDTVQGIILEAARGFEKIPGLGLTPYQQDEFSKFILLIENIKEGSIRSKYQLIYNQLCVLAVSAMSAMLEEYFENYINSNPTDLDPKNLEKIKITLSELAEYNFQPKGNLGQIILDKGDGISFQDLQAIIRVFKDYLSKDIVLEEGVMKHIIFYQQCRNVIVHKGGVADSSFITRIEKQDANIKSLSTGSTISLDEEDWKNIKGSFLALIEAIIPEAPSEEAI